MFILQFLNLLKLQETVSIIYSDKNDQEKWSEANLKINCNIVVVQLRNIRRR